MELAKFLLQKHENEYHRYIREKLRQVGRLLLFINKETDGDYSMSDLLTPRNFDILTVCLRNFIVGEEPGKEKNSLALKLMTSIKQIAQRYRGKWLRQTGDPEAEKKQRQTDSFITLIDDEWRHTVSSRCLRRMYDAKLNKYQVCNN